MWEPDWIPYFFFIKTTQVGRKFNQNLNKKRATFLIIRYCKHCIWGEKYCHPWFWLVCLPVVHWWKGHGATVHGLGRWRRQRDLVVGTTHCTALVGYHRPASAIVFTSCTRPMPCSHLCSKDAGRGARVGVGVASMVHWVGVVVLIWTVTPESDSSWRKARW